MKLTALIAGLLLTLSLQAQSTWLTNMDTALVKSQATGKPILLVFSGSDWCKPCIQLKQAVLNDADFIRYAEDHELILVNADFPRKKKNRLSDVQQQHNDALAETYNPQGAFPLVLLLDGDGEVMGEVAHQVETAKDFTFNIGALIKRDEHMKTLPTGHLIEE